MMKASLLAALLTGSVAPAYSAADFVGVRAGLEFRVAPRTEMRMRGIVQQAIDWSCASASVATLVADKFGVEVAEQPLFDLIVAPLAEDPAALRRIEQEGMTAAHLLEMAHALGFQGQGVRRSLDGLLSAELLPVIARITESDPNDDERIVQHWVVVSRIDGGRVLIRDPLRGNRRLPTYAFASRWLNGESKGFLFRIDREAPPPQDLRETSSAGASSEQPMEVVQQ